MRCKIFIPSLEECPGGPARAQEEGGGQWRLRRGAGRPHGPTTDPIKLKDLSLRPEFGADAILNIATNPGGLPLLS